MKRRDLCGGAAAGLLLPSLAARAGFGDPLDQPALVTGRLASRPLLAVAQAGARVVAVGLRGLAVFSDDAGRSWQQAAVPVQSDLVAVHFPSPQAGWAAGHDGVILHSADGGRSWRKQLDGRQAATAFAQHYAARLQAGDPAAEAGAGATQKNFANGPALPYLDVCFEDMARGFAVGSFGMLVATADGGRNWLPWFERIDNPEMLNLNAVRRWHGQWYVAAERGIVFRFDARAGRFRRLETGYGGSLFGLAGSTQVLLAFGLRGAMFRSVDQGDSWQPVASPTQATLSAGYYDLRSERFMLVSVAGELLLGDSRADHFAMLPATPGARYAGVGPVAGGACLVAGAAGVRVVELPKTGA